MSAIEAKKHSYRQTQDGIVVSFVLHPNDVPTDLAIAPLGTRYGMALVEITDETERALAPEPEPPALPAKSTGGRKWDELSPAQQAGMLCADVNFQNFLEVLDDHEAARKVRERLGVKSRADLDPITNPAAVAKWGALVRDFRSWQHLPPIEMYQEDGR